MKESNLEKILTLSSKEAMMDYLRKHPEDFSEAVNLALSDKMPYSWRAAWIIGGCMENDDERIKPYLEKIIDVLKAKSISQMRELMIILQRMEISGDLEGKLFDVCVSIWEKIDNKPSIRHNAFRIIMNIAKRYPELKSEIKFLTEPQYTDDLSPGVKRAVMKLIGKI